MIGIGARLLRVQLEEGARALAVRRSDARERLLDQLAARGAAGREVGAELGYSPHEDALCGGKSRTCSGAARRMCSAAAVSSAAARRASCSAMPATPGCRAWVRPRARAARSP